MSTIRATAFAIADRIVVVEVPVEFAGQEVLICLASDATLLRDPRADGQDLVIGYIIAAPAPMEPGR